MDIYVTLAGKTNAVTFLGAGKSLPNKWHNISVLNRRNHPKEGRGLLLDYSGTLWLPAGYYTVGTAWTFILGIISIWRKSDRAMGRYAEIDSRKAGYDGELCTELFHKLN
jgi:hypothetical protein